MFLHELEIFDAIFENAVNCSTIISDLADINEDITALS